MVGSSIVRESYIEARTRPGGTNLGLGRLNVDIWWQGYGGMRIQHLQSRILFQLC